MIGQTVVFDGHRLNDRFYVGEVAVGLPEFVPSIEDHPAFDGARMVGKRLGTVGIDIALVTKPVQGEAPREALSDLMAWLDVDGPRRLALSEDRGLWRLCVPRGAPQVQDDRWNDRVVVSLTQLEPALYGLEREVTVPSGGSVTVRVGGDYPTKPTISSDAAVRDSTTLLWGLRLDGSALMYASVPVGTASSVVMDCAERTCSVNGATTIPSLTSDWFELTPGTHTFENAQGSGASVVRWYERWHR